MPLISIVIANYNYGRFLEDAIQSVIAQDMGDDVELIICDGGSTDNSVEIIKKYAAGLPPNTSREEFELQPPNSKFQPLNSKPQTFNSQLQTLNSKLISWWCSEKDGGQSAAFNKGFSHARGKYLTWLNADDVIPYGALKIILASMRAHPDCEWFTGNHLRFLESDKVIIQVEWGPHFYPKVLQRKNSPLVIFGPTSFFAKSAYERVGGIDESLHLAMDTDLWLRFQSAGIKQRRINCYCWAFRMHENSKTAEFDGHRHVTKGPGEKLAAEHRIAASKVGYKPSIVLRCLCVLFRVLDGSFVKRFIEQRRLMGKTFDMAGRTV